MWLSVGVYLLTQPSWLGGSKTEHWKTAHLSPYKTRSISFPALVYLDRAGGRGKGGVTRGLGAGVRWVRLGFNCKRGLCSCVSFGTAPPAVCARVCVSVRESAWLACSLLCFQKCVSLEWHPSWPWLCIAFIAGMSACCKAKPRADLSPKDPVHSLFLQLGVQYPPKPCVLRHLFLVSWVYRRHLLLSMNVLVFTSLSSGNFQCCNRSVQHIAKFRFWLYYPESCLDVGILWDYLVKFELL